MALSKVPVEALVTVPLNKAGDTMTGMLRVNNDARFRGQMRAGGWWNTPAATDDGPAVEAGMSGATGYILCYDRATSTYKDLEMNVKSLTISPTAGEVTIGAGRLLVPNQIRVVLVGGGGAKTAGTYSYWGDTNDRVLANTGGGWNSSTKIFTAPVTGNYLVTAHIRMSAEQNVSYNYMQFTNSNNAVNGTPMELWAPAIQSGGTYRPRQLTAVLRLNKNDTLTPQLSLNGTATLDAGSAGQADDYLNITLIN